jgi:two-component system, NarL family, nitrate/nitrite response regulator NarL
VATTIEPETGREIRVLVADDNPPARAGVRLALESEGITICAEVSDAASAVEAAIREHPDICLLETNIPGGGIAATEQIAREVPSTTVVMFAASSTDDDLFDALRAGADGYLLKDINPQRLGATLRAALHGEAALPRRLVARLIEEFRGRGGRRLRLLSGSQVAFTSREVDVLALMRQGLSTAEIAARLFITEATVRSHIAAVVRKLGVPDREAALEMLEERFGGAQRRSSK